MSVLAYVLMGLGYGLVAAAQPGPFQAYLISQALARGWQHTLPAILAPLLSDGPIIAIVLIFLTRVPEGVRIALHFVSGIFICYLAWSAYRQWRNRADGSAFTDDNSASSSGKRPPAEPHSVLQASLMNLLGPGPYLFWSLVAGPVVIQAWTVSPDHAIAFLVAFYAAMLVVLAGIILAFGSAQRLGPGLTRALLGLSILALGGFGLAQLWQGATRLMAIVG